MERQRRRSRAPGLILLIGACTLLGLTPVPPAAAGESPPPEPTVIQAEDASLTLAWRAPSFSLRQARGEDGVRHSLVEARGWPTSGVPGEPALPQASAVAVIPPTGGFTTDVESSRPRTVSLSRPLRREPAPEFPERYDQPMVGPATREGELPAADGPVAVEELGWLRGHRLVRLTFSPLTYDEDRETLRVVDEVRVRLTFSQPPAHEPPSTTSAAEADGGGSFVRLLQNTVVNPEQVEDFTGEEEVTLSTTTSSLSHALDGAARYKIAVEQEGIYELTYEALRDAGLPLDQAPPEGLALHHAGEEVPYAWEDDDDDGTFGTGDRILFYARPSRSRWATHDVYWLSPGGSGTLMTTRSGDPGGVTQQGSLWATVEAESNIGGNNYFPQFESQRDGDHWYWEELRRDYGSGAGDYDKRFEISLLEPDGAGVLSLYVQGTTASALLDPDHRVAVALNEENLGHVSWDGPTYHTATLTVPAAALQPGSNEVRLTLSRDGATDGVDKMWLDAIEVRYPVRRVLGQPARVDGESGRKAYALGGFDGGDVRVYDVSQPISPTIVTVAPAVDGWVTFADADSGQSTYYVLGEDQIRTPERIEPAQELPGPSAAPDYLIISHSDFIPAVAPLAEHRAAQGLTVHTVPVEGIYDAFGDGRLDPQAIKNYVAYAYEQWAPNYLLLVGDGTHDPLNHYDSVDHRPTFIPPYLAMVDPFWGEVPSDNLFATVVGDDQLPDLYVGRLPVNTVAEAETVVGKILDYEQAPPAGPWNEPLLFFADKFDGSTDFHAYANEMYEHARDLELESHTLRRLYYCEQDCTEYYQISDGERMTETILSELSRGALMATWVGHSSWHQWSADPVLFHVTDLVNLDNGGALPLFLQMTCFTSYFSQPTTDTLDESLLRMADGGAVATWGPTGLALTPGHVTMQKAFVSATWGDDPTALGPATVAARMALRPNHASLWDTYVLFGDPAMELNLEVDVWPRTYIPLVVRNAAGGD
ncbi:MAG: C25 family cysteine peptidase [Chloroflexota bacterium]